MQWSNSENAGFTAGEPWIGIPENYMEINAEKAMEDLDSIFYHYQKLIELRKKHDIIIEGDYLLILEEHPQIFAYLRRLKDEALLVVNNFYKEESLFELPEQIDFKGFQGEILISNYDDSPRDFKKFTLRPYESIVYHLKK